MHTLNATLLAAQKAASSAPYLRVLTRETDLDALILRWERWYAGTEKAGPAAAAVPDDGALLRARINPSDSKVYWSRVASPTSASTFSSWTAGANNVDYTSGVALAARATRALLLNVLADGVTLELRESTDSGATWATPTNPHVAGAHVDAVAVALLASSGTAALFWATGNTIYRSTRTGTGAWGTPTVWTNTLAALSGVGAISDGNDYHLLVSGVDADDLAGAWHVRFGAGGFGPPNSWSGLVPIALAAPDTDVTYRVGGNALALFDVALGGILEDFDGTDPYTHTQLARANGWASLNSFSWRDPAPFPPLTTPYPIALAATTTAPATTWLVTSSEVWHAAPNIAFHDLTDDVLEADLTEARESSTVRLLLDNSHGRYSAGGATPLRPPAVLSVGPGYHTTAGLESMTLFPHFRTTHAIHLRGPASRTVELRGHGAWGALGAWNARSQLTYEPATKTALQILSDLSRRAGVSTNADGASLEAETWQPGYTVPAARQGDAAYRGLLARLPDFARQSLWTIELFEPLPDDPINYAYGTDHPILELAINDTNARVAWARVHGAGTFAEASNLAALTAGGLLSITVDDKLDDADRTQARADTLLRRAALETPIARVVVRPNVGTQLGDVVTITDPTLGLDAAPYRVAGYHLRFSRSRTRPRYDLELTLTEV